MPPADTLLADVDELLARHADTEAISGAMHRIAEARPDWSWVGVYLLRDETLHLGPYVGPDTEHTRIPVGTGVCGTAIALDANVRVDDVATLDNYLACSASTRSELVVLVRHDGEVVGQIDVDSDEAGAFGPADEALLEAVAERIAPACARLAATASG